MTSSRHAVEARRSRVATFPEPVLVFARVIRTTHYIKLAIREKRELVSSGLALRAVFTAGTHPNCDDCVMRINGAEGLKGTGR